MRLGKPCQWCVLVLRQRKQIQEIGVACFCLSSSRLSCSRFENDLTSRRRIYNQSSPKITNTQSGKCNTEEQLQAYLLSEGLDWFRVKDLPCGSVKSGLMHKSSQPRSPTPAFPYPMKCPFSYEIVPCDKKLVFWYKILVRTAQDISEQSRPRVRFATWNKRSLLHYVLYLESIVPSIDL